MKSFLVLGNVSRYALCELLHLGLVLLGALQQPFDVPQVRPLVLEELLLQLPTLVLQPA